jgi:hypothetical protein
MDKLIDPKIVRGTVYKYRSLIWALAVGTILFGVIFPDSLSDHYHFLHFSAHFGMSFLIGISIYLFCNLKASMKKPASILFALSGVIIFGAIYKLIEIYFFYSLQVMPFLGALSVTGFYTSMSQNLSGVLAAFALIIYFDNIIRIKSFKLIQ